MGTPKDNFEKQAQALSKIVDVVEARGNTGIPPTVTELLLLNIATSLVALMEEGQ